MQAFGWFVDVITLLVDAADIIRTVAVVPSLQQVTTLGVIVLIRTFLSIAIQVELEGRWPWAVRDRADR